MNNIRLGLFQESSDPFAQARGFIREVRVKLSERAIASAGLLAVSYARAKVRQLAGLRGRPPRTDLRDDQLQFREPQIERFAHHLAMLDLCAKHGIGLWSRPIATGDDELPDSDGEPVSEQWSVAVVQE